MSYRHSGRSGEERRGSRRSPSPSHSRSRREREETRDPRSLPESFGRGQDPKGPDQDDSTVLQRMKTHYINSPLSDLYYCVKNQKKVKIWTRNFKEVRGVMTGYLLAFDKHWNVVLKDVDEVFLKPKKNKTPFLREIASNETFQELPAKVPRQKKDAPTPEPPKKPESEGKRKKSRRKPAKSISSKRQILQLFIRGDNIVMVCPFEDDNPTEEEEIEN